MTSRLTRTLFLALAAPVVIVILLLAVFAVSGEFTIESAVAYLILLLAVGLVVAYLTAKMIHNRLVHRLNEMRKSVVAVSEGRFDRKISSDPGDAFDPLSRSINTMCDDIALTSRLMDQDVEKLTTVLESMTEAVISVDEEEKILFMNQQTGRLFGIPEDQMRRVVGRSLLEIIRNNSVRDAAISALESDSPQQIEFELLEDPPRTFSLYGTRFPVSHSPGVVLVIHETTELRRLENIRREFVANVSHELKTPLASIQAYAETLSAGAIHDQDNNVRFVNEIEGQADRLHRLIIDLLRIAQIESGKESFEILPTDVEQVITESAQSHRQLAETKSIEVTLVPPKSDVIVMVDRDGLQSIADNLLNNALKYTPENGTVTIRWYRESERGIIEVADTGVGIPAKQLDRVFERFYRVDGARSRELGGTGLGLSIVKQLSQAFGGSVAVTSELSRGSSFFVRLPLSSVES